AVMASAADVFQGKRFGSIFGALNMLGGFGGAFGAWLGGFAFDKNGAYRAMFVIALSGVASIVSLVWIARPRRGRTLWRVSSQTNARAWSDQVVTEKEA